jgi:tRNA(Arg) A34 adenosine deaminase TadA
MPEDDINVSLMREAIEEAKKSVSEDQGVHPKVGAILTDKEGNVL